MPSRSSQLAPGPFRIGREIGRSLWRRPVAPLLLASLLLGWGLLLSAVSAPLVRRLVVAALGAHPIAPVAVPLAVFVLVWNALLSPLLALCLGIVEVGPAESLARTLIFTGGLGTVGLLNGLAVAASQCCLLAALTAAGRHLLRGGSPVATALLWALPAGPALLLGAVAGGAGLLATARIAAGELPARTPGEGLRALAVAGLDLIADPLRTGAVFSALLLITFPFSVMAAFMGMAAVLVTRAPLAGVAFRIGAALAGAAALLWIALGLRRAMEGGGRGDRVVPLHGACDGH